MLSWKYGLKAYIKNDDMRVRGESRRWPEAGRSQQYTNNVQNFRVP